MDISTKWFRPLDGKPIGAIAHCAVCGKYERIDGVVKVTTGDYGRRQRRTYWPYVTCCGRNVSALNEIKGRVTDQPCDARCQGAHGPNCDCSCGGKNHGVFCG